MGDSVLEEFELSLFLALIASAVFVLSSFSCSCKDIISNLVLKHILLSLLKNITYTDKTYLYLSNAMFLEKTYK